MTRFFMCFRESSPFRLPNDCSMTASNAQKKRRDVEDMPCPPQLLWCGLQYPATRYIANRFEYLNIHLFTYLSIHTVRTPFWQLCLAEPRFGFDARTRDDQPQSLPPTRPFTLFTRKRRICWWTRAVLSFRSGSEASDHASSFVRSTYPGRLSRRDGGRGIVAAGDSLAPRGEEQGREKRDVGPRQDNSRYFLS